MTYKASPDMQKLLWLFTKVHGIAARKDLDDLLALVYLQGKTDQLREDNDDFKRLRDELDAAANSRGS